MIPALLHVATPSAAVVEAALYAGYDGVVLDLQHGEVGLEKACDILRLAPRATTHTWARAAGLEPGAIGRLLDAGAKGIVAPSIETGEEARALVAATKYPPLGRRSLGPTRPALYEGESYTEAGNAVVRTVAQIETARGVEAADEILSTHGVDAVYIGPADLAVSYGLPGRADWEDGPVRAAIELVAARAREHGVAVGIYTSSPAYALSLQAEGLLDFVGLGIDLLMLGTAARANITALRSAS